MLSHGPSACVKLPDGNETARKGQTWNKRRKYDKQRTRTMHTRHNASKPNNAPASGVCVRCHMPAAVCAGALQSQVKFASRVAILPHEAPRDRYTNSSHFRQTKRPWHEFASRAILLVVNFLLEVGRCAGEFTGLSWQTTGPCRGPCAASPRPSFQFGTLPGLAVGLHKATVARRHPMGTATPTTTAGTPDGGSS